MGKRLYEIMGLQPNATESEIRKAYRKLALTHHPDRGGDPEQFKELTKAYETLTDPKQRAIYDQVGDVDPNEMNNHPFGGMDPFSGRNPFHSFFNGMKGGFEKKPKHLLFDLNISLEDVYNGCTKKLRITKNIICVKCNGHGVSDTKKIIQCKTCQGKGMVILTRQLGPNTIQQVQTVCSSCHGQGKTIPEDIVCKVCEGAKLVKQQKILEVPIRKGIQHNEKIVFHYEGDIETPSSIAGDVIVTLNIKPHSIFTKRNNDLIITKTISLLQALTGFHLSITHLDQRTINIASKPNEIYTPETIKVIREEGLPHYMDHTRKGDLYILFKIQFPTTLTNSGISVSSSKSENIKHDNSTIIILNESVTQLKPETLHQNQNQEQQEQQEQEQESPQACRTS
jgi:DnaJ family protein A protein 2